MPARLALSLQPKALLVVPVVVVRIVAVHRMVVMVSAHAALAVGMRALVVATVVVRMAAFVVRAVSPVLMTMVVHPPRRVLPHAALVAVMGAAAMMLAVVSAAASARALVAAAVLVVVVLAAALGLRIDHPVPKNASRAFPISPTKSSAYGLTVLTYIGYAPRASPCLPIGERKRKRSSLLRWA